MPGFNIGVMRIHFHVDGKTPSVNNLNNLIGLGVDWAAIPILKNMTILIIFGLDQQMIDSASGASWVYEGRNKN